MAQGHGKVKIPDAIKQYIKRDASKDARMLAAKAAIPMSPLVQVTVLTFLLGDPEKEVQDQAKASLLEMPESMLKGLFKENLHPKTIDFFVKNKTESEDLMEQIVLNKNTPDEAFVHLAANSSGKVLEIISNNQMRMLRCVDIANGFKKNPNASKAAVEKVVSFLRMSGVQLEGESAVLTDNEVNKLIKHTQKQVASVKNIQAAVPVQELDDEDDEEDFYSDDEDDFADDGSFGDDEFGDGDADLFDEKAQYEEEDSKGIEAKLADMTVPQKVKIALMGNKEVRGILIKDPNKIVATAVIKSPKLTDNEVHSIAQMRSVNDEIIRTIASNKDWVKNYTIKLALANNPKTPLPIALKFMRFLNMKDIGDLSRNKNVSPQIQKLAKQQFNKMRGTG